MSQNSDIEAIYPLSPAQEGILFHSLYDAQSGVYIVQASYKLRGNLDTQALKDAWRQVISRHSILRAFFVWERREKPLQLARARADAPWAEHDWRELNEAGQAAQLEDLLRADREKGFELSKAPLMRLALCRLGEDINQLILSFHHILLDGWSLPMLLNEVMACYKAYSQGHDLQLAPRRPYRDYINWLRQQDLSQAEAFWRETLRGFTAPTALAIDRARGAHDESSIYEEQSIRLSEPVTRALNDVARRNGLTLNTLVQGAYALLLSHYSGSRDVVFGVVSSGRSASLEGIESMIGLFINTLPMRVSAPPQDYLAPWLQRLQERQFDIMRYEYSPLVQVRAWSDAPKDIPLFENIFVFENYPVIRNSSVREDGVEIMDVRVYERTNYPLTVTVGPGAQLYLRASYDVRRFDASAVARLLRHFEALLTQIAARPEQPLSEFSMLTRAEREQFLFEWNDTATDYPTGETVHGLFEAQAARTPDAVALVFEEQSMLYGDLDRRANQLARRLRRLGVGPEVPVGVFMERSIEMVVSLLGVLKAGGAYLPLDPEYPPQRLAMMLEEAQPPVLLTQRRLISHLQAHQAEIICVDSDWQSIERESADRLEVAARAENAAYVIYTSGSTGQPKGSAVYHRGVTNLLSWFIADFEIAADDRVLVISSANFDLTQKNFFAPLMVGATLRLSRNQYYDPTVIRQEIGEQGATLLNCTPSAFYPLVEGIESHEMEGLRSLRLVFLGGEPIAMTRLRRWLGSACCRARIINTYGPTESTDVCAYYRIEEPERFLNEAAPIGRPIANTQIYLLTGMMQPAPVGVSGELYIGGVGLGLGYLKRPELTAEKFIPNPFSGEGGGRLYRTGDLARYREDGAIEFIGRSDHQVKIRGFRIELSEIETALAKHPSVGEAVALAREDASGDKSVVAYLRPESQGGIPIAELREYLREKLPHYMIPAAFVEVSEMPLTPNGKVDRRALAAVEIQSEKLDGAFAPPSTEVELAIAAAWREVLHIETVGVHDNFFDLGGNSLRMIQLRGKLQGLLQTDVSMNDLFRYSTVSSLAAFFSRGAADTTPVEDNGGRIEKLKEGKDLLRQRSQRKQRTL